MIVGTVVVVLSAYVGAVQGNLLEVTYKVVNLITVPLFGLFFMAIFVPWAKGWATILGAIGGMTVVVTISFWKELTGSTGGISFLWAMPLSFLTQNGDRRRGQPAAIRASGTAPRIVARRIRGRSSK